MDLFKALMVSTNGSLKILCCSTSHSVAARVITVSIPYPFFTVYKATSLEMFKLQIKKCKALALIILDEKYQYFGEIVEIINKSDIYIPVVILGDNEKLKDSLPLTNDILMLKPELFLANDKHVFNLALRKLLFPNNFSDVDRESIIKSIFEKRHTLVRCWVNDLNLSPRKFHRCLKTLSPNCPKIIISMFNVYTVMFEKIKSGNFTIDKNEEFYKIALYYLSRRSSIVDLKPDKWKY